MSQPSSTPSSAPAPATARSLDETNTSGGSVPTAGLPPPSLPTSDPMDTSVSALPDEDTEVDVSLTAPPSAGKGDERNTSAPDEHSQGQVEASLDITDQSGALSMVDNLAIPGPESSEPTKTKSGSVGKGAASRSLDKAMDSWSAAKISAAADLEAAYKSPRDFRTMMKRHSSVFTEEELDLIFARIETMIA